MVAARVTMKVDGHHEAPVVRLAIVVRPLPGLAEKSKLSREQKAAFVTADSNRHTSRV